MASGSLLCHALRELLSPPAGQRRESGTGQLRGHVGLAGKRRTIRGGHQQQQLESTRDRVVLRHPEVFEWHGWLDRTA